MKRNRLLSKLSLAGCVLAAVPAAHAVVFNEMGDAGQTVAGAQSTTGASGSLTDVFGSLSSTADIDLYLIRITSPSAFSATTVGGTNSGNIDTMLFLLTTSGAPVYLNDDAPAGTSLGSLLQAGGSFGPVTAGTYLLGISLSGIEPVNIVNQLLFAAGTTSFETRGPASGLQPATLGGYDGLGFGPVGAYDIQLTGATVAVVPEPATSLLLLAGALGVVAASKRARHVSRGA